MNKFEQAKIQLPDGSIALDCSKLAQIPVEGIKIADYQNNVIIVQTRNTKYVLTSIQGRIRGQAFKVDGSLPKYLAQEAIIHFHGSTYGGSMIRMGFIGVDMHLEFSTKDASGITTSSIQSVQVASLDEYTRSRMAVEQMLYGDGR